MSDEALDNVGGDSGERKAVSKSDWDDVHARAMDEYARDYEHDRRNIEMAYADLAFRRGEIEDQWDPQALKARQGREDRQAARNGLQRSHVAIQGLIRAEILKN